jgi:NAD(P)-dependent dehydrogenase (short-subunit alcohol dehydrogenase family)
MSKVILITGASSGIGHATALTLIAAGHRVYGAARRVEKMSDLEAAGGHAIAMDVTNTTQVADAVSRILAEQGQIDVLINNAGYAVYGAVEDVPIETARRQFEVNLFGLADLTQRVLPHMRERRSGHILNITSVGGKVYSPLGAWYHATKHALEGWSDCLRVEMASFGIDVSIIEPGAINSGFGDVMTDPMIEMSGSGPYGDLARRVVKGQKSIYDNSPSTRPQVIADVILKAVDAKRPKTRYVAGKLARTTLAMRRWLSDRMFDRALGQMLK